MTVRVKEMIDEIISTKAANNPMLAKIIGAKLILHGFDSNRLAAEANDDPQVVARLEQFAKEL